MRMHMFDMERYRVRTGDQGAYVGKAPPLEGVVGHRFLTNKKTCSGQKVLIFAGTG